MVRSYLNPQLGPPLPKEMRSANILATLGQFLLNAVPLAMLVFAALGSILFGLATPTEAAAMGAFGAVVLTMVYGRLKYAVFREALLKTLETAAMILFLAVAANMYGAVFTRLGTINLITNFLTSLPLSPIMLLILIQIVIFILGWPLEWPAIILIFLPIFIPMVQTLGFDLIWFSVLTAVTLQTTFLSPPVAMAAYQRSCRGASPRGAPLGWPLRAQVV
jgi:TRAP-type mannitol/chloroaromatic compound transport system permease large subunit